VTASVGNEPMSRRSASALATLLAGILAAVVLLLATPATSYAAEPGIVDCSAVVTGDPDFEECAVEDPDLFGDESGVGPGIPAGFAAWFVLIVVAGVGFTVWQVSKTRSMARRAGMDPNEATAMTLLSDGGFEATYLAANLRNTGTSAYPVPRDVADRLRELQRLKDQELVTADEYAARRQAIIDGI
jgi:hypothetical protein